MAQELDFTRFTELLLARIYEEEKRQGPMIYFDARELMSDLSGSAPDEWVWQAAQYLDQQGLTDSVLAMQGEAQAMLTPAGRIFVEQGQGTGLIAEYRSQDQIVVVMGDGNQVAVGHGQQVTQQGSFTKEEALELVDELEATVNAADLSPPEREDALADVRTLREQLGKHTPNLGAIRATLAVLSGVAGIATQVEKLTHLLH